MDIPDDAEGRVAIFTVDATPEEPARQAHASRVGGGLQAAVDRLGTWMDATYAGVAIAVTLAIVLALGLLFLRR